MSNKFNFSLALILVSFSISFLLTPIATHFMYKYKLWKKKSAPKTIDNKPSPITAKIYGDNTRNLPRFGGTIVVGGFIITTIILNLIARHSAINLPEGLDLLANPHARALIIFFLFAAFIGFLDDLLVVEVLGKYGKAIGGGLSTKLRLALMALAGLGFGFYSFDQLGIMAISVPYLGTINLGVLIVIPIILIILSVQISAMIDAFDGLSSGIFSIILINMSIMAALTNRHSISFISLILAGGILAHLYFNIPPARFMLSEVGALSILTAIAIMSIYLDAIIVLPIIAFPLVVTTASTILQLAWKKVFKRKLFIVSPIHNLLVYKYDWSKEKVVMRYWLLTLLCNILGLLIYTTGVIRLS